ncbi:Clp protease N-terminal domain-containing protein [Nonomuraea sp. N2-4H]|uniref:Clp protease N-terminal domain-containing protein n=1 Tax=Nonomuraea sp. N2-4H TaxID=3128898 RepID=UPI00324D1010
MTRHEQPASSGDPTPTPRYEAVVEDAARIARSMGPGYVGAEHLFLALLRDRDAVPTQVLAGMVELGELEAKLVATMGGDGYRTPTTDVLIDGRVRPSGHPPSAP